MWWRNTTLVFAILFLIVGIAGFIPGLTMGSTAMADMDTSAGHSLLFGLFPVNALHNIVHLAFGLWGFFAYFSGRTASRVFLRSTAVIYAVLTVFGFIPGLDTLFGLVPLSGNDIWLHALLAIIAGYVGFVVTEPETEVASTRPSI